MTVQLATTRLTLLNGATTTDALGDTVDATSADPASTGVPGSLIERERVVLDPTTGEPRTLTQYHARLTPGTFPAKRGDRVRDERDGSLYVVESVKAQPRTIGGLSALRLILSKTSA